MKRALITGISGQDGSYLAELLLDKGYEVHGVVRRAAIQSPAQRLERLQQIVDRLTLHGASLESYASLLKVLGEVRPDECYHLAAQSFVPYSFDDEFSTLNTNVNGTHHMLSAIRQLGLGCRFYFAGSSEMFGLTVEEVQHEGSPCRPRSAYGLSKLTGFHLARLYREAYGVHACSGILFNHESPRRGLEYVSRKITHGVARIKLGLQRELSLGNLDARRDWGYAKDYVDAMWRMLQQDAPDDYVVATNQARSVRDLAHVAFEAAGLDWRNHVVQDEALLRPADVPGLRGDYGKAERVLGWKPQASFEELIDMMVRADLDLLEGQPR